MKKEPLKNKHLGYTRTGRGYFLENDIKSAVEFLRQTICSCEDSGKGGEVCFGCEEIKKAFPDLYHLDRIKKGKNA